jgi:hypothetical protein
MLAGLPPKTAMSTRLRPDRPLSIGMLWRMSAPARRPAGFIEPCLPTLGTAVPSRSRWAYEIKHDGIHLFSGAIRPDLMEAELRKAAGDVRR